MSDIWGQIENMMAAEITVGELNALRDEIEQLNAENDRLRAAINAWADAEDASNALWAAKGPRKQDAIHDAEAEIDLTLTALRKAVGR